MAQAAGQGKGDGKATGRGGKPRRQGAPLPQPSGSRVGPRKFVREAWGELRKVQWPAGKQVVAGTAIVAVVTAFFATFVSLADVVALRLVDQLQEFIK